MTETMDHPDEGLIHDFVDDELTGDERGRIEAHLAGCASCRTVADAIVRLREDTRRLLGAAPKAAPDQWRGIERSIQARRRAWRLSPAAAAASVALLMAAGAALYGTLAAPRSGTPVAPPIAAVTTEEAPAAAIAVAYAPTLAELERILAEERDGLQPETVALVEANLALLDSALREIEAALVADPAHRGNLRSLEGIYQTKVNVLLKLAMLANGA